MLFPFKYTIFCSRTFRNRQKVAKTLPEIFSGTQQNIEIKQKRPSCMSSETEYKDKSWCSSLIANYSFLLPSPLRSGISLQIRREKSFSYHSAGFWWSSCSWPLGEVNCFEKATVSEHLNASLLNHIQDTNFITFWALYRWTSKRHFYIVFQFSSEA